MRRVLRTAATVEVRSRLRIRLMHLHLLLLLLAVLLLPLKGAVQVEATISRRVLLLCLLVLCCWCPINRREGGIEILTRRHGHVGLHVGLEAGTAAKVEAVVEVPPRS